MTALLNITIEIQIEEYSAFAGGYFDPAKGAMYYVTDWQGNNVAVVDKDGAVEQQTIYYPYGEPTVEPTGQRYLFAGKEREHAGGRNTYDFGARSLTSYGRWGVVDSEAERKIGISPYAYCFGDPINYYDPDGNREWPVDNPYIKEGHRAEFPKHSNNFGSTFKRKTPHTGVDINIGQRDYDQGAPVYATHSGVITRLVPKPDGDGGGIRITIMSADGQLTTSYMHMDGTMPNLKLNQSVKEGQQIGVIGNTGHSTGPHLHYEIAIKDANGERIDPSNGSTTSLKDAQKILDNMTYRAELEGIEVYGVGMQRNLLIPKIELNLCPIPNKLKLYTEKDFQ